MHRGGRPLPASNLWMDAPRVSLPGEPGTNLDPLMARLGVPVAVALLFALSACSHVTVSPSRPAWLDEQRIFDQSQLGREIKRDLRAYVAERQALINGRAASLEASQKLVERGQQDETAYKSEKEEYELFLNNLKAQVQARKAVVLGEFDAAVDRAVAQVLRDEVQSDDPNLLVIQALDRQTMAGTQSRPSKRACEYEDRTGRLTCREPVQ